MSVHKIPRYWDTNAFGDNLTLHGNDLIVKGPWVDVRIDGAVGDGVTGDAVNISSAIDNAYGKMLLWPAGTYILDSAINKTFTGDQVWVATGPVTIKYTGADTYYAMAFGLAGNNFTMRGPFTLDANSIAGCSMRVDNNEPTMATASKVYMEDVTAINGYSDTIGRYGIGLYFYGAFSELTLDRVGARNITRAATNNTSDDASIGIGVEAKSATSYAAKVLIRDPVIDNVTSEIDVGHANYYNMDCINAGAPSATTYGGTTAPATLRVEGGRFTNCSGRSIKSQFPHNVVDGPTFIHDANGKRIMDGGVEVDFQYGSGVLTNWNAIYDPLSGGGSPWHPNTSTVVNASSRDQATGEGAFVVSNGIITNNVPVSTDNISRVVQVYLPSATAVQQSVNVNNNVMLGEGGVDWFIQSGENNLANVTAVGNYVRNLNYSFFYCYNCVDNTNLFFSGNSLYGATKNLVSTGVNPKGYYGTGNTGFTDVGFLERSTAQASVSDNTAITHYTGSTPKGVICTTTVANEFCSVTDIGDTTFILWIKKHDGTAGTAQTIYWKAFK